MAKQKHNPELPGEVKTLLPSTVKPAEDPGKTNLDTVKLNFGEVLVSPVDEKGNEGLPFKVNYSTYQKYFSNEKYILKKKQ